MPPSTSASMPKTSAMSDDCRTTTNKLPLETSSGARAWEVVRARAHRLLRALWSASATATNSWRLWDTCLTTRPNLATCETETAEVFYGSPH